MKVSYLTLTEMLGMNNSSSVLNLWNIPEITSFKMNKQI